MSATTTVLPKSLDDLRRLMGDLGVDLPVAEDLSPLAAPLSLRGRELANRFVALPMEGCDAEADGSPSELTFRRYRRFAAGGAGLIWFEACAVTGSGRSNPGSLWIQPGNVSRYADLVRATREAAPHPVTLILQLTHSGRYSKPEGKPAPVLAHHSPLLDKAGHVSPDAPLATDDDLDRLQEAFVQAAHLAVQAGFDGVDMKACHGYLVSGLLAAHTRPGRYGDIYENRTRFVRECTAKMRATLPEPTILVTRMNVYDGIAHPHGWGVRDGGGIEPDLAEPKRLAQDLQSAGSDLLGVTLGFPRFDPHYNRPFDKPLAGVPAPEEHPLIGVQRFVDMTRAIRSAAGIPVVGGGLAWLRQWTPQVMAGLLRDGAVDLAGLGRMMFAYPDAPSDALRQGQLDPKRVCVTCSFCSQIMKDGAGATGCVIRDREIYLPVYQKGRAAAQAKGLA